MADPQNPQEMEKMVRDYQMLQEQIRVYSVQLEQLKVQKSELERANEEVGKSTGRVYMSVGGVIVETTKEKAATDLKDRSELSDTRINSISKQLTELRTREKQLNDKITELYKAAQGPK